MNTPYIVKKAGEYRSKKLVLQDIKFLLENRIEAITEEIKTVQPAEDNASKDRLIHLLENSLAYSQFQNRILKELASIIKEETHFLKRAEKKYLKKIGINR